ncbi:hypothetical protein AXE80_06895 [Wenyingzhuangia fucanilytica]|uniref:Secretion system C-terminal sorting domain-containing protein n=1 Tax=Wenyingzhuangia fucanilytica TaxID=1790137 RepID=A0A1B1Y5K3_9FLAO|nr:T9SS type A sorting domain-containing protein [Wenyingzhuangia fucanilytica]ANW96024.1 hypothetical protein AXE80_06895 [Wenyingzhuangia fucanilytica]
MKKIILSAVMATTMMTQAQYVQNFESTPTTNDYLIGNNGPAATPKMIGSWEVNPEKSGINTSDNCIKDLEEAEAKSWAYPVIEFGTGGFIMDATNGKYLKIKILSTNKTDFSMTLSPRIGGVLTPVTQTFNGVTLNTWFEAIFDYSTEADGYVSRLDFYFDKNEGVYYIDDLTQTTATTLGTKNNELSEVLVYPNPANNTISISGNNNIESIAIYDVLGKEVLAFNSNTNLDISSLMSGIYILKTNNGSIQRFVKK